MRQVVMDCIGAFGYWGVFALIAVENIFPPIPSEVILTFAGFCTAATALRASGVVAAATLGSLAGALVLYGVGRLLQPRRLDALLAGARWGVPCIWKSRMWRRPRHGLQKGHS